MQNNATKSRIQALDALRGFSLLGIVLINACCMNTPYWLENVRFAFIKTSWDQNVAWFLQSFVEASVYPIFSCLFGAGAALFLATKNPYTAPTLYKRRMLALFGFGLLQVLIIWWGDILMVYALLGIFLLPLLSLTNQQRMQLLYFIIVALVVSKILPEVITFNYNYTVPSHMNESYATGNWQTLLNMRIYDALHSNLPFLFAPLSIEAWLETLSYFLKVYAFMLFGFILIRNQILPKLLGRKGELSMWLFIFAGLNLATRGLVNLELLPGSLGATLITSSQALIYMSGFLLLYSTRFGAWSFSHFAVVGKTSLSSYLLQNFMLSCVLYAHGLGLYGHIGPGETIFISLGIYGVCWALAALHLREHEFGPLEKLWRQFTYGGTSRAKVKTQITSA
jgi:uncharacterized protein